MWHGVLSILQFETWVKTFFFLKESIVWTIPGNPVITVGTAYTVRQGCDVLVVRCLDRHWDTTLWSVNDGRAMTGHFVEVPLDSRQRNCYQMFHK